VAIVVQHINRAGAVIATQKFDQNRIVLGRALDCDVILQDPHIDPRHLEVELDPVTQRLTAADLSTLNGSWRVEQNSQGVPGRKKNRFFSARPFFSGQVFELGRTHVRVCAASHQVAPAIPVSRWETLGHALAHWWIYSLLIALLVVLQVWDAYLSDPESEKLSQYALNALYPILAAVGFAGLWGFIGKNIRHDAKFPTHLSAALAAVLAVSLFEFSAPYWAFQFGLWQWQGIANALFSAVIVFILGWVTLNFATHLTRFVRLGVALVVPVVLLIPTLLAILGQPDFQPVPPYDRSMVEPSMQFRAGTDVQEFLDAADELYVESLNNLDAEPLEDPDSNSLNALDSDARSDLDLEAPDDTDSGSPGDLQPTTGE